MLRVLSGYLVVTYLVLSATLSEAWMLMYKNLHAQHRHQKNMGQRSMQMMLSRSSAKRLKVYQTPVSRLLSPPSSSSSSSSSSSLSSSSSSSSSSLSLLSSSALHLVSSPIVDAFSAAFVGGTVGVMGMAFVVETRKLQDESLDQCPYCMGTGEILCGECLGVGESLKPDQSNECQCSSCLGRKLVVCINCKGDGRNMPIILQAKSARDPDYAVASRLNEFDLDSP